MTEAEREVYESVLDQLFTDATDFRDCVQQPGALAARAFFNGVACGLEAATELIGETTLDPDKRIAWGKEWIELALKYVKGK